MALRTQHIRNGERVTMPNGWGWWHVERFLEAWRTEDENASPFDETEYTYTQEHTFTDETDGEVLTIMVGDKFRWWRDR